MTSCSPRTRVALRGEEGKATREDVASAGGQLPSPMGGGSRHPEQPPPGLRVQEASLCKSASVTGHGLWKGELPLASRVLASVTAPHPMDHFTSRHRTAASGSGHPGGSAALPLLVQTSNRLPRGHPGLSRCFLTKGE